MKKLITSLFYLLLISFSAPIMAQGLFISEVADPGDNYNARFVELYNASGTDIDLSAGNYYLVKQANGTTISDIQLTGTIAAGATYVIAYSITEFNAAYGFDPDQESENINGNGDDGYFLYEGGGYNTDPAGTLTDAYGVLDETESGIDGTGQPWEYTDSHAVRVYGIDSPNPTWTASEWSITAADVADMTPGVHQITAPSSPVISGVTISPELPSSTDQVTVTATVTDDNSVASVTVYYSTSSPVSETDASVAMTVSSGDVYTATIPEQADQTTVYYMIKAVDDEGNSTTSSEFSYEVKDPVELTIAEIQTPTDITVSDASPYVDTKVLVTGIVYAVTDSGYFIQDGEGAWNGIYVYDYANTVAEGDEIAIGGLVNEFYNLTQIKDIFSFTVNSSGNPLYAAAEVSTAEANNEEYEGVLLKVSGTCVSEPDSHGVWSVDDSSGPVNVDDKIYAFTPTVDVAYSVTGAGDYNYGSRKILPRSADDVEESTTAINQIDTRFSIYPNPFNQTLNISTLVDVSEVSIIDILGKTVKTYQPDSNLININTSNLEKGIYLLKLKTDSGDVFVKKIIKR